MVYFPVKRGARGRGRPGGGGGRAPGRRGRGRAARRRCPAPRCASPSRRSSSAPPTPSWPPRRRCAATTAPSSSSPATPRCSPPTRSTRWCRPARRPGSAGLRHHGPRRTPQGYGRVVHAPGQGAGRVIVEEKDATAEERQINEVNAGLYAADADFLWTTLSPRRRQERPARVLPDRPGGAGRRRPGRRWPSGSRPVEASGVNDQEDLSLAHPRADPPHRLLAHGGGRDHRGPGAVRRRRGRDRGPGHAHRARRAPARGRPASARAASSDRACILVDTVLGDGVHAAALLPRATGPRSAPRCIVGPFARLRPEPELAEGVHIGNFVETEEDLDRQGLQGEPPHLPGRRHHRRRTSTSAAAPSPATTTARRSTRPGSATASSWAPTPSWWRPSRSGRGPTWPPARRSPRASRPARWRWGVHGR